MSETSQTTPCMPSLGEPCGDCHRCGSEVTQPGEQAVGFRLEVDVDLFALTEKAWNTWNGCPVQDWDADYEHWLGIVRAVLAEAGIEVPS